MDVDVERRGGPRGEQPPKNTQVAVPSDQTALCIQGGDSLAEKGDGSQSRDTRSDSLPDYESDCEESQSEDSYEASSHGDDQWALLHGFQGAVPFLVDHLDMFESAVERLLSLPPGSTATYVLVHFNARGAKLVEITDRLGSGYDGEAAGYIAGHWGLDDDDDDEEDRDEVPRHPDTCCALFVRLEGEQTPSLWRPTEGQLQADVAQIKYTCPDVNDPLSRGPASTAYLSFPKTAGPGGTHVGLWDAGLYTRCVQTAVDVLLGRRGGARSGFHHHHAILQLAEAQAAPGGASFSPSYGAVPLRPSDVEAIHGLRRRQQYPGAPAVQLRQYPLDPARLAVVLPGFYPPTTGVVAVMSASDLRPPPGATRLPNAFDHLRRMVTQFLGAEAAGVRHVRLLSGDATLGPPARLDRRRLMALLPLSDAVMAAGPTPPLEVCRALARFLDMAPRFIVLYPQYGPGEVRMRAGCLSHAPAEERLLHPLPPLDSSADDFRTAVAELARAVRSNHGDGAAIVAYEPRVHEVSVRALLSNTDPQIETSTFFVGPRTTDEEWFSIRAQLPTRNVEVNVWTPGMWDCRRQVARSNVWGPRYGRAVDGGDGSATQQGPVPGRGVSAVIPSSMRVGRPASTSTRHDDASPEHHEAAPEHHEAAPEHHEAAPEHHEAAHEHHEAAHEHHEAAHEHHEAAHEHHEAAPERRRVLSPPPQSKISKALVKPTSPHRRASAPVTACPHAGCGFTFRSDEKAAFEHHVRDRHIAHKCLWCAEPLPAWWTDEAKDAHLRSRHRDRLMQALGVRRAGLTQRDGSATVSIALARGPPSPWLPTSRYSAPPVDVRRPGADDEHDERWRASAGALALYGADQKFCDRCGRDRRHFSSEAEQAYHDRHCAPGMYHGARCTFCPACGDYRWGSALDAARSGRCDGPAVSCGHAGTGSSDQDGGRFCELCGLDRLALLRGGREAHDACCRGYGAQPGRFCPHCGLRFWEGHAQADWYHNTRHIETCEARDGGARRPEGVTAPESREDDRRRRVLSEPPGGMPAPLSSASSKKQKPKPKRRPDDDDEYDDADDDAEDVLPSVEHDTPSSGRKRRRHRRPDDSDYEYNSDVDSADGLTPDASDPSSDDDGGAEKDPEAARRRKRRRRELDPAYRYETDEDSADGLPPDVDDLAAAAERDEIDVEAEAEAQAQGLAEDAAYQPEEDPLFTQAQEILPGKEPKKPSELAPLPSDTPTVVQAPSPPPPKKGRQAREATKKAPSPKERSRKPAPKKPSSRKPKQAKMPPAGPPRRSARLGSRKP